MDYCDIVVYCGYGQMGQTLDGSWTYCYTGCMLGRAPRTQKTMPDFCENMDPDKWDITVRYRVTRYPRVFRRLTVSQWTPGF